MKSSEYYQQVFEEVFHLLIKRGCNTRGDFSLLNDWLMGYARGSPMEDMFISNGSIRAEKNFPMKLKRNRNEPTSLK